LVTTRTLPPVSAG